MGPFRICEPPAAGETESRPFVIQGDPRVPGVTDADLQKQFQLAIKLRDGLSRANQMVMDIRDITAQIEDHKKKVQA